MTDTRIKPLPNQGDIMTEKTTVIDHADNVRRVVNISIPKKVLQETDWIGLESMQDTLERVDYEPVRQSEVVRQDFETNLANEVWSIGLTDLCRVAFHAGWIDTDRLRQLLFNMISEQTTVDCEDFELNSEGDSQ